jgi:hypothetical protein
MKKLVTEEKTYQAAKKRALELLKRGYSLGGKKMSRREVLHER